MVYSFDARQRGKLQGKETFLLLKRGELSSSHYITKDEAFYSLGFCKSQIDLAFDKRDKIQLTKKNFKEIAARGVDVGFFAIRFLNINPRLDYAGWSKFVRVVDGAFKEALNKVSNEGYLLSWRNDLYSASPFPEDLPEDNPDRVAWQGFIDSTTNEAWEFFSKYLKKEEG